MSVWKFHFRCESIYNPRYLTYFEGNNFFPSILILRLLFSSLLGQYRDIPDVVTKVATSAANWLKIESGARSIGMGGSQVASGRGISGAYYNPASIAYIKGSEVYYSKSNFLAILTHFAISLSMRSK